MDVNEVMTIGEAAAHLGVARASVYKAIENGAIHETRALGRRVVYRKDVEDYAPRAYQGKRQNTRPEGVKGPGGRPLGAKGRPQLQGQPEVSSGV